MRRRTLGALALAGAAAAAWALSPVVPPRTTSWDVPVPGEPGRQRRILAAWPEEPPPPGGYPVLVLLDGNATFPIAVAAARQQERRAAVAPAVLIGVGYPGEEPSGRLRDYTPPAPGARPGSGGADAFLDFLAGTLLPEVARRWPVDPTRQAIFGHSLGGLLVLYALFTRPGLFRRSIAASPSIWWQDRVVLEAERRFAARPAAELSRLSLLVMVGGDEEPQDDDPRIPPDRLAWLRRVRMIGNARELADRLAGVGPEVSFLELPGHDHGSVVSPAISQALRFALRPEA
ncbi:alpha/beta hydrolase [Roseicella aquatilis]|nr:alpha/beta hydrolase-fold protein [Roseicella aquatilis]